MRNRRKNLTVLFIFLIMLGVAWNYLFYPGELWIRYSFANRSDEITGIAAFIESQDKFRHFQCIEEDVLLDLQDAPAAIREELQNHCRLSRINMGYKTDFGSFYPLSSRTWLFKNYMLALVHSPNLDDSKACARLRKPDPGDECILRLADHWAINYWNAILDHEDLQELAEDVAETYSEQ
jgi:hypothetical protein